VATIDDAIYTLLTSDPNLAAQIGDRVHPIRMPQEPTLPALVYQLISGGTSYSLSGDSRYRDAMFQVSVFDTTFFGCTELVEKVIRSLSAFRGTAGGIDVQMVRHNNTIDIPEDEPHEYTIFHRALDFEISYLTNGPDP
jgi:hypothetical protein